MVLPYVEYYPCFKTVVRSIFFITKVSPLFPFNMFHVNWYDVVLTEKLRASTYRITK